MISIFSINKTGERTDDTNYWTLVETTLREEDGYPQVYIEYVRTLDDDYDHEYHYEITANVIVTHY